MPADVEIIDKDMGWDEIVRRYEKQFIGSVEVGVSDAPHEPTGQPTDEIGTYHEFGLGVPERSFLRAWVDANRELIRGKLLEYGIDQLLAARDDWREPFGQWCVDQIRANIWAQNVPPPNAPATLKRKTGTTPLVDTTQLVNAIMHEVRAV